MSNYSVLANPLKAWLAELLLVRGLFSGPNGWSLYSYQVTALEFESLQDLLKTNREHAVHPVFGIHWAAGYCLFVAEHFRRYYDAGSGGWSWAVYDEELAFMPSPHERSRLVESGLVDYWGRTIRVSPTGRDLLGSLFVEGGLPWLLVRSENHGFGRAVRRGLRHAYSAQSAEHTVGDVLANHEDELPKAFQNLHTRQLLAGIVEQLVELVKTPELMSHDDPAAYLDEVDPNWRNDFPIPLDVANARSLVNDWLLLAGNQRKQQARKVEKTKWFTCDQYLHKSAVDWSVRTVVNLPKKMLFKIDHELITSTRLQLCIYEGDKLLVMGGFVYGQMEETGINIRFPQTQISVIRKSLESTIVLKLQANGQVVFSRPIDSSEIDTESAPLVFVDADDGKLLVANESCVISHSRAQVRLPVSATYSGEEVEELATESWSGLWLKVTGDLQVGIDSEMYSIRLVGSVESGTKPYVQGVYSGIDNCLPRTVYLGWPIVNVPEKSTYSIHQLTLTVNDKDVTLLDMNTIVGAVKLCVRDVNDDLILKRSFGVLPTDFSISLFPESHQQPCKLILRSCIDLEVEIENPEIHSEQMDHRDGVQINLRCKGEEAPKSFNLNLRSKNNPYPLRLKIPYPSLSAILVDERESQVLSKEMIVGEMLGKRIILCSGETGKKLFNIRLRLLGSVSPQPVKDFSVIIGSMPVEINLHEYREDVEQMLAATTDQDSVVHIAVSSVTQLLDFNVRRYNAELKSVSRTRYSVDRFLNTYNSGTVVAEAMLLSDPRRSPVVLPALKSQGVSTGQFEIPPEMERESPWLIYPTDRSSLRFRPGLFLGSEAKSSLRKFDSSSLHRACQDFHPVHSPNAIKDQIAIMADDLGHSGWQYMADLKQKFGHLPLSTFESWKALSDNPEALAVAIYRLELDEVFCERVRNELSTLWECVSLEMWQRSYKRFQDWLEKQGFPASLVTSLVSNRIAVLREVVTGFEEFGAYIRSGRIADLPATPPIDAILPQWYQALRRNHESNEDWPTELSQELTRWIKSQSLPDKVKDLSQIHFSRAVTYLPIFMAYVTVGRYEISELHASEPYLRHTIRNLSEFERLGWYNCTHAVMVAYLLKDSVLKQDILK